MKLSCDICGGALEITSGGQGASCTVCGLGFTMVRLREKLNIRMLEVPELTPPLPEPPGAAP